MSKVTFPKQKSALLPWADGVSLKPAPGGGILRISYDEERFLLACKEVILEPQPEEKEQLIIENGEAEKKVVKKVEIKNEEVLVLVSEVSCRWRELTMQSR